MRRLQLCVSLLALAACATPASEAPLEEFPVAVPKRGTGTFEREYVGEVHALQRAELRARTRGVIESLAIDEGQPVNAGQLLFTVSVKELQQELRGARAAIVSASAELKAAQLEHANVKMLFERKIASPAELAQVEGKAAALAAKEEVAKAAEGRALVSLQYAEVRAPFDGVVNRIPRKVGSLVADGDLLTTVTNTREVFVYFRVSEAEYLEYAAKGEALAKEVGFRLADGTLLAQPGVTDAVESEFDRNTGTIAFRAKFANEAGVLKHGSTGKVVVRSDLTDALIIPQKSTFEVQEHVYVYTVDSEGRARARRVVPKLRLKEGFVIESGLKPDERIIVEGIQHVREGLKIAVRGSSL